MMNPNSIKALIYSAREALDATSHTVHLDVEILLADVLEQSREYLYTWPEQVLTLEQVNRFMELVQRRKQGEPIAYLIHRREFWSLPLRVTKDTLIPRPETEILVATVCDCLVRSESLTIADLGTGCGAIALALARECRKWNIMATDISEAALKVAEENASRLLISNVQFRKGRWYVPLDGIKCHAIVSNPPYVAADSRMLQKNVLRYEPEQALIAADGGFADLIHLIEKAKGHLVENGWIFLEHGSDQGERLREILRRNHFKNINTIKDLAGLERVSYAQLGEGAREG